MDYTTRLKDLAATEHLLVVSDFDGTLCDFATDIYGVEPNEQAIEALRALSELPRTTVAALSGRHLEGLAKVFPLRAPVILGGSHGAETSGAGLDMTAEMEAHLAAKDAEIREIMSRYPGTDIEVKPYQRVFHSRQLFLEDPDAAAAALEEAKALDPGEFPMQVGNNVVEFSATAATKGSWIEQQREALKATAVVFVGDDVTDENGFAVLNQPPDFGVKVGLGDTAAQARVADVEGAAQFFTDLAAARADATA